MLLPSRDGPLERDSGRQKHLRVLEGDMKTMSKRPTVLMILDGYGLNKNCDHNAVCEAKTPVMDQLMSQCPFVEGQASGMFVGLPDGQMGNSEVGHLNMGAGRIVYQELTRITKSIQDGDFFEVPEFLTAVENCKKNGSALHLFGDVYKRQGERSVLT